MDYDEQITNHVLDKIEKEYSGSSTNKHLSEAELEQYLDEIHNESKSEEKYDITNDNLVNKTPDNSDESVPVYINQNNSYIQKCNQLLKDENLTQEILDGLYAFCGLKGLTCLNTISEPEKDKGKRNYCHVPTSLLPHLMPLSEWLDLRKCSILFHKLIDAIARDSDFLLKRMKCIADADPKYTGKFYAIYKKQVEQNEFNCKYIFNSLRCDYMRNGNKSNQIWSHIESQFTPGGAAWIGIKNQLHEYILNRYVMDRNIKIYDTKNENNNQDKNGLFFTPNDAHKQLCKSMAFAAKLVHRNNPLILVISDSSRQDANMIALTLWEQHRIKTIFRTYTEIGANGKIEDDTKDLIIDNKYKISFVYCRGGSKRTEWNDMYGMDWKGRELIEFSSAISDCNIAYTLINTKFMQTIYSQKDILLKYLPTEDALFLYKHFVGNYNFDPKFTSEKQINNIISDAKLNPNKYVMKPSGDGGGHCIFGDDIPKLINKLQNESNNDIKLEGWILMEKIKNCTQKSIHVRDGIMNEIESVHELGIYSQYLCDADTGTLVLIEDCIGDLFKTRNCEFNEAGIASGCGVVDSVILDAAK